MSRMLCLARPYAPLLVLCLFALSGAPGLAQETAQDTTQDTAQDTTQDTAQDTAEDTAQDKASASEPRTAVEEAEALIEEIEADSVELAELRTEQQGGASAEERQLGARRVAQEEIRIGRLVHELARVVLDGADEPGMAPVREQVAGWLEILPSGLDDVIDRRRATLEAARLAREDAGPEDLVTTENDLKEARQQVADVLRYYARTVVLLGAFEIDDTAARQEVVELLSTNANELVAFIDVTREERTQLARLLALSPDDGDLKREALQLDDRRDAAVDSLRGMAEDLRTLGIDTSEYQKLLVQVTGNVSDVGLNVSV
ncbi:MAG: hypothetical protein AAGE01_18360, partial [Pseudomonadota bacterium]